MTNAAPISVSISRDAALVLAGLLSAYFHGGEGPLAGVLSPAQASACSELLTRFEREEAVSPILLGPRFTLELAAATQRIEAADA